MVTTPKILIIDDSNTECVLMRQALQSAGYQVLIANDGVQGLHMLSLDRPQCLVLDIVLPGMSGFEVCRQLRAQAAWHDLPIVFVSTKSSSADLFWAKRQGANHYLTKPFKGEALVQVIDELLAGHVQTQPSSPDVRGAAPSSSRPQPVSNTTSSPTTDPAWLRNRETPAPRSTQPMSNFSAARRSSSQPTGFNQPPVDMRSAQQYPAGNFTPGVGRSADPLTPLPSLDTQSGEISGDSGAQRVPGVPQDTRGTDPHRPVSPINPAGPIDPSQVPPGFQHSAPLPRTSGNLPGNVTGPIRSVVNRPSSYMNDAPPLTSANTQQAPSRFLMLIPRRSEHAEMLWSNSPDALFITDRSARQLYLAIDGKTDVGRLCVQIGIAKEEMFRALRVLISQQRIQLFDVQGRKVDGSFLQ
ncbi:response regulator [Ktedonobacteria bacterium brp13]|nr:response regulator [Ktedonobacteria bacterium brp13]